MDELAGTEWRREGDAIVRDLHFKDFAEAMAYVNRVADLAEEANHHPDILVHGWNNVRLTLTTHSEGGLTDNDFQMARTASRRKSSAIGYLHIPRGGTSPS